MKQLQDIIAKLKDYVLTNKKLAIIVGAVVLSLTAGAVVFYLLDEPAVTNEPIVIPKPTDNKTARKPDNKTADNKTADNRTLDNATTALLVSTNPYTAMHKKDPFLPLVIKKAETAQKKQSSSASLLHEYDISDYKLIATVSDKQKRYAMVILPDGKAYTLTEGARIGTAGRRVHKIDREAVIFKEPVRDRDGKITIQDVTLKLRKEEG